jgi:hypothetical protein
MDKKTKGAWLVHHTNKLQNVNTQHGFENVYLAGKIGILLSAISSDNQYRLDNQKVKTLAKAANINTTFELPKLLEVLKKKDLIEIGSNGIDVLGVTSQATLQHTSEIFDGLNPAKNELASIDLSEKSSIRPQNKKDIQGELSDLYSLNRQSTKQFFKDAEQIGFVDAEKIDDNNILYFNGNLFRREETRKVNAVLNSLSSIEEFRLNEFTAKLKSVACIEVEEAKNILGKKLFQKVSSIGLFDVNIVSNNMENVGFVTRPSAFSKYSSSLIEDAFDLAKAFVSSLTYGMTRSSHVRGEIRMIEALLNALVNGRWVGPVQAIGEDYKILELKHVVEVKWGSKGGRSGCMMRMLKKEVAALALQVIQQGDASDQSLSSFPGASVNKYSGPEVNRERIRRKQLKQSAKSTNDMLMVLRTGGGY